MVKQVRVINSFQSFQAINQYETLHKWYKYIEDMHVTFSKQENYV